ncbi:MAG: carbon-nitrogen hydrolase family protein [Kiloniellales bacterium]
MRTLKVACVQNCATPDVEESATSALALSRRAIACGAQLVCLPEFFAGLRGENGAFYPAAFEEPAHPVLAAFREAARKSGIWFLLGSLGVRTSSGLVNNRAYVIDGSGAVVARYDKIHLFDVALDAGRIYRESTTIEPGAQAVVAPTPWGGLGLSICYDLRFAALYRALAKGGASLLAVPAAFTKVTGEAHWHVLNRARAIETGSFVISPCQYGRIQGGGECFGHSLIVDPWGRVLAEGGEDEAVVMAELDLGQVERARRQVPALKHDRPIVAPARVAAAE